MSFTGLHYDKTGLTLDAHPSSDGAWSATGVVAGSDSNESGKYEFAELDEDTDYTIRIRGGGSAAASDQVIAILRKNDSSKSLIRSALNGLWTDEDGNFFILTVTDAPE